MSNHFSKKVSVIQELPNFTGIYELDRIYGNVSHNLESWAAADTIYLKLPFLLVTGEKDIDHHG